VKLVLLHPRFKYIRTIQVVMGYILCHITMVFEYRKTNYT